MTEKDTGGLLTLCDDFSALTHEHKRLALAVFQGLIQTQDMSGFDLNQGVVVPMEHQGWGVKR
jgi:hypothetical protein